MIYDLPVENSAQPSDWEIKSLKQLATVVGGGTPDTAVQAYWNPPEVPWVTPTDITGCSGVVLSNTERSLSQEGLRSSAATLLPPGTTLLTSRATVGECKLAGVEVATNQGFASLVPQEEVDARFLFYLAQTLKPTLVRLGSGTTFLEVSRREIRRVKVCVPTQSEEREQIGCILKAADDAIAAAEAKLTAARRLKTALMQQLFTRGIPGRHSRLKQTKIGEIPESWEVQPLGKLLTSAQYGLSENFGERGQFQILRMTNIENGYVHFDDPFYIDLDDETHQSFKLEVGDILFNRTNSMELVGRVGIVRQPTDAVFASYLVRLRANQSVVNPFYLNLCLNSYAVQCRYKRYATPAVAQANINPTNLRKTLIAFPPLEHSDEQNGTVELVESVDATIDAARNEINALHRLKRSLLQNLLTGRVRVRMEERAAREQMPLFSSQSDGGD